MFQDWQTIAVWLIIVAALCYVGQRGWGRVRSFRAGGKTQAASCASGCGSCSEEQSTAVIKPQNVLVQIKKVEGASQRQGKP